VLDDADRDRLLAHIGLDATPPATFDGLRTVHRAYVSHVPFENIAVQLGESQPIDPPALVERIVKGSRGGYCFEANSVFFELLESLSFEVERREAIVGPRTLFGAGAPTDHLALVVRTAEGVDMIAEGGFGEGPVEPLFLREGPQTSGSFEVALERDGDGWWFNQHEFSATPGFRFGDAPAALDAFAPHHLRLSTSPDSNFVKTLLVQQPYPDRVVVLRARTLFADGRELPEREVLDDAEAFAGALHERFGIDLDVLGPQRLARLWALAEAQHEAHLAGV
jgi:N-hydroxyarylamine O-acetyltransferase